MNRIQRQSHELFKIKCAEKPVFCFRIVYTDRSDKGEYFVALDLRYHLFYDAGADVPVCTDDAEETPYEIVIGDTYRGGCNIPDGTYTLYVRGTKLYILADSLAGYLEADRYLTGTLLPLAAEQEILVDGFEYTHATMENVPPKSGEFRMLLQNIWGVDWGSELMANRDRYAAAMLLSYQPDLLFVNEYWTVMRRRGNFQKSMERNGYTEVVAENWSKPNVIPIFYKTGEWRQLECRIYDLRGEDESKTITLAVLQHIPSGKTVTCCDTHLEASWNCSYEVGNIRKINDVRLLEPILKEFLARYPDAPFLFGADCNCTIGTTPFQRLLDLGLTDAHDATPITDDRNTCHGYPLYDQQLGYYVEPTPHWNAGSYAGAIDHILYRGNLKPRVYQNLAGEFSAMYSDHFAVMFEFDIPTEKKLQGGNET
ncbi:MAG: hypothetical protein J6B71_09445 [Clostridia bacterium]|nr:hypothetical protein [Clostridia bacterium]